MKINYGVMYQFKLVPFLFSYSLNNVNVNEVSTIAKVDVNLNTKKNVKKQIFSEKYELVFGDNSPYAKLIDIFFIYDHNLLKFRRKLVCY